MRDIWDVLKKVGIVLAIVIPSLGWLASTVRYRTIVETLKENDEKQEAQWTVQDERWYNQNVINGKFDMLYDYFIPDSPGTTSGTEEEGP